MSLMQRRPRVTVNGIRRTRTFHYFWCQNCRRTIRFTSTNPQETFCPHCSIALHLELDITRPRFLPSQIGQEPSPAERLLESLSLMIDPPIRQPYNDFDRRIRWAPEPTNGPWITLQFVEPSTLQRPNITAPQRVDPPRDNDAATTFTSDTNLGIFDDMALNDHPGPPPASASAIQALAEVKITEQHLVNDTHCPVCKDMFEVDGEVRMLPCNHMYHSDCIIPWLSMHNTCPVCRCALRDDPEDDFLGEIEPQFGFEEVTNWFRNRFFSLRVIRAFSDWTQRYLDFLESRIATSGRVGFWWCSWLVL